MSFDFSHDGTVFHLHTTPDGQVVCGPVQPPPAPQPIEPSDEAGDA